MEEYLKLLFGDNYHGFNFDEAMKSVGVSYLDFLTRIQNVGGELKISTDIKTEPIYYFTLFCYYNWFGYPIKVVKAPEFCDFLKLFYGYTDIEHINIMGKTVTYDGETKKPKTKKDGSKKRVNCPHIDFNNKQSVNIIKMFSDLLKMPCNATFLVDKFISALDVNNAEVKIIKDFHDRRTIARQIAMKLDKLFFCLFPSIYNLDNLLLTPKHRKDIMNILTAFGLTDYTKYADLLKNHKHLMNDSNIFPTSIYTKGKVFIHSGEKNDHFLVELSREKIIEAIVHS